MHATLNFDYIKGTNSGVASGVFQDFDNYIIIVGPINLMNCVLRVLFDLDKHVFP